MVLVTPDMHRVHHSVIRVERDTNFGFNLPWWDYLCGTYRAQPEAGHEGMTIGIEQFRQEEDQYLHNLLIQPFRNEGVAATAVGDDAIDHAHGPSYAGPRATRDIP